MGFQVLERRGTMSEFVHMLHNPQFGLDMGDVASLKEMEKDTMRVFKKVTGK